MLPIIYQITQLSSTSLSVITLGHIPNVPLIRPPSELGYRLEPHDHILVAGLAAAVLGAAAAVAGVYPGVVRQGGYWEGAIPGSTQPSDLRLI